MNKTQDSYEPQQGVKQQVKQDTKEVGLLQQDAKQQDEKDKSEPPQQDAKQQGEQETRELPQQEEGQDKSELIEQDEKHQGEHEAKELLQQEDQFMKEQVEQKSEHGCEQKMKQTHEKENIKDKQEVGNSNREETQVTPELNGLSELKERSEEVTSNASYFYRQQGASKPQQYKRRTGTADMTGELFEVNVASLLFIRGMMETDGFHLATNVDWAGAFDDLIFKFKDIHTKQEKTCFLQLESKMNSRITRQALCAPRGDFSLFKYYASYCEIYKLFSSEGDKNILGSSIDDCEFIIYTNTTLECEDDWCQITTKSSLENTLFSGGNHSKVLCLQLGSEGDKKSFKHLKLYREQLQEISSGDIPMAEVRRKLEASKLSQCKELLMKHEKGGDLTTLLNDQLTQMGDRNRWEQFLKNLKVYTCQAIEGELEDVVKRSLEKYCGISGTTAQEIFTKLSKGMLEWWRKADYLLTENYAPFWNTIMEDFISDLVAPLRNTMTDISKLQFQDTQNISHIDHATHIITPGTTKLSCLKVSQSLADVGHIMIDSSTLYANLSEVMALWRRGTWYNVLVVEGETDSEDVITKVADVLCSHLNKKLVIIACESDKMARNLGKTFQCKTFTDNFSFSQLSDASQKVILDHKVDFQGSIISLKSLTDLDTLKGAITADIIVKLLTGELKVGQKLADLDDCYISRTLMRTEHIHKLIFKVPGYHHLAVSGISAKELQQLVPPGETAREFDRSTETKRVKCSYYIIDGADDFTGLCEMYNNIHWLHKKGDNFVWKRSKGNVEFIRNYAATVTYNNWKDIMDLPEQVVLVVAEPGMGKSTEVAYLTSETKAVNPSTWVIRVDLNDHTDFLSQNNVSGFELLVRAGKFNNEFQQVLLESEVHTGGKVTVLFDGFDEISPNYAAKVIHILQNFSRTNIKKIWVTSRPSMREVLEEELSTLHFGLKLFSLQNQEQFLHKFWKMTTGPFDMKAFIDKLLTLTKRSLDDKLATFTGIPLQTRMLAEAFQIEARCYSETGEIKLPYTLDLLQLYDQFVSRKWEIYWGEKSGVDITKVGVYLDYQDLRRKFLKNHMNSALITLLSPGEIEKLHNSDIITKKCHKFLKAFKKGRDKTGIIFEVINGRPVFIHRTFQEYIVAMWFSEHFESHRDYLREKMFDQNFQIVRNFFDRMIAQKCDLHVAVLNRNKNSVQTLLEEQRLDVNTKDRGGRTPLHMAVINCLDTQDDNSKNNIQQITEVLLEHGADTGIEDQILYWRPLRIADQIKAHPVVIGLLLEKQKDGSDLILTKQNIHKNITGKKMLHIAAENGQLCLVQFLKENNANIEDEVSGWYNRTALLVAAGGGNVQVAQYLIDQGANISARDNRGFTALLIAASRGHLEMFKLLSKYDSNFKIRDNINNDNVLHHAAKSGNTELTKHILDSMKLDINTFNRTKQTPLILAVQSGHLQVTQLLTERGASISAKDDDGNTALLAATFNGHFEIFKLLLRYDTYIETFDRYGERILLYAAQSGNVELTKYVLDIQQPDINCTCSDSCTSLWYAAMLGWLHIAQILCDRGANLDKPNDIGWTPLFIASKNGNLNIVKYLTEHGATLSSRDYRGNTALLIAALSGQFEIFKFLLQFNVDVKVCDEDGNTVLHHAAQSGNAQLTRYIIETFITDVDCFNMRHQTPLWHAALSGRVQVTQLLCKKGANINMQDFVWGYTPLHAAADCGDLKVVKYLVQNGANLTVRDANGRTPIRIAYSTDDTVRMIESDFGDNFIEAEIKLFLAAFLTSVS